MSLCLLMICQHPESGCHLVIREQKQPDGGRGGGNLSQHTGSVLSLFYKMLLLLLFAACVAVTAGQTGKNGKSIYLLLNFCNSF